MKRRKYLASIGAAASGLALAGCGENNSGDTGGGDANNNNQDSGDAPGESDNQPDIELLEHTFYEETYSAGVRGTAVNNTDNELSYVEAKAVFLDEDGTQIGDGLDNVTDLAPGREWEFDCVYLGEDPGRIAEYEISVSSGF